MDDTKNSRKASAPEARGARRAEDAVRLEENIALAALAVEELANLYPDAACSLEWAGEPWRLLVMGRLSAQCTDARVNVVCRELFSVFPSPEALAAGDIEEIERIVRPCGLFRTKAAQIKAACARLCREYGGVLPSDMDELLKFEGVGRKIANLLRGDVFGLGGIVADTHCIRICGRLGFYPEDVRSPEIAEKILSRAVAPQDQTDFCHRLVVFGREVCTSRAPHCGTCRLRSKCCEKGGCEEQKS